MKITGVLALAVPLSAGVLAALTTSIDFWYSMKDGLIAFLGFLAASVVQIMSLTTNFLQADKLLPAEAERLTRSLTKQQHYWIGLLSSVIFAMVVLIVGAALKGRINNLQIFATPYLSRITWLAVVCFFIASTISFVFIKMIGLFQGLISLHKLRSELVILAARRLTAERIKDYKLVVDPSDLKLPAGYGEGVKPH